MLVPIGMLRQFPRARFSRLPRVRPGAEAGRPVSKSILIGAPIPYAERSRAGIHGEAPGRTVNPIVLLLRSYLAQDGRNVPPAAPTDRKMRLSVAAKRYGCLFATCKTMSKSL